MSESLTKNDAGDPRLDFASLTPADWNTYHAMTKVVDTVDSLAASADHHKKFIRRQGGDLAATRSPLHAPEPNIDPSNSGYSTEADGPDDADLPFNTAPCNVLSLNPNATPDHPETGYLFGTGDLARFPETAGVDILLPPPENPLPSSPVYSRHGYFAFDSTKYSQLWLHARHKGIRVNDRPLPPKSNMLLESRTPISVGPYRFVFEFKVVNEKVFQAAKQQFLSTHRGIGEPYESTAATSSTSDIRIQHWLLCGIVGVSPVTVIHAATNVRSGEVVAVKRLCFGAIKRTAEEEVNLYATIASSIREHRYSPFVMQMHSILSNERAHTSVREVYLLWKPLARGDFSEFGISGKWYNQPVGVKMMAFVQVLLGLSALHDCGWIHRDLKPANLGIVDLGDAPLATIMDEGQAIRASRTGHPPVVGHCGTIGYLAPELENNSYSANYGKEIDIWSMGAVAVFVFLHGRIPWSRQYNMFVPEREAKDRTLSVFKEFRASLLKQPEHDLSWLIGSMLEESPRNRPTLSKILSHPSLREALEAIEGRINADKHAGMKRSRTP